MTANKLKKVLYRGTIAIFVLASVAVLDYTFQQINNEQNHNLYNYYKSECVEHFPNMILGGRLACYQYFDMHQAIGQAMHKFSETVK